MVCERTLHYDPTQRDQTGWRENHSCEDGCKRIKQVKDNPTIENEDGEEQDYCIVKQVLDFHHDV